MHASPDNSNNSNSFLATWSLCVLGVAIIFLFPVVLGASKSLKMNSNNVKQWLPRNFAAAKQYDEFVDQFGVDEMVVISWPQCTLDNPEVEQFCKVLERDLIKGDQPLLHRTVSAERMAAEIQSLGISKEQSLERIQGLLIGPDEKTTCILAFPSRDTELARKEIISRIFDLAETQFGIPFEDLKLGGPTVDGAAIDIESRRALDSFIWITVLVVFFLSWLRLRDLTLAIVALSFSLGSAFLSLSILYWTGGKMNLTMIMLPTLTFIMGVSSSIHMINYYRKASFEGWGWLSADRALKDGALPVILSAVTTAIGMASLGTSQVEPIKWFGIYSAIGILASVPVILLLMPSVLFLLKGRVSKRLAGENKHRRQQETGVSNFTSKLVHVVCKHNWAITIPAIGALLFFSFGIQYMEGSVSLKNRFADRTKIIQDYRWLESNMGALIPMEVILKFDKTNELESWEQMLLVRQIEKRLMASESVASSLSAATFKPKFPKGSSIVSKVARKVGIEKWQQQVPNLENAKLIQFDGDNKLWRISLRVNALNDIDYGEFIEGVKGVVDQQLVTFQQPGITSSFTGTIPLFYHAQHQILSDLKNSFVTAFIFISFVLMMVLRSFPAGLVAMLPNIFPPMIVFGAMGWMGVPIEIGSVMTASVALGIAVDDTIHFLTWYRRGVAENKSRMAAIRYAFAHCAKPMIDTTLICGFGVAAFMFSDFMPTVRFSRLLFVLLMAALVGDLLFLPAILASPAGKLFRKRGTEESNDRRSNAKSKKVSGKRGVA